jgi:hypothetical protein
LLHELWVPDAITENGAEFVVVPAGILQNPCPAGIGVVELVLTAAALLPHLGEAALPRRGAGRRGGIVGPPCGRKAVEAEARRWRERGEEEEA